MHVNKIVFGKTASPVKLRPQLNIDMYIGLNYSANVLMPYLPVLFCQWLHFHSGYVVECRHSIGINSTPVCDILILFMNIYL